MKAAQKKNADAHELMETEQGTMSSPNIVENDINPSNPRMESTLRAVDGDSNAKSKETSAAVTDLISAETSHDRERALKRMLTQAEASRVANPPPTSQPFAAGDWGSFYIQHGVLVLDSSVAEEFARLGLLPTPKPVSEADIDKAEKEKAEKKKAEHKRYKAKKKAEAAAKREVEKEAANEVEEEVAEEAAEDPELPKSQAELQAEEDARLGDRRIQLQAKRQEQEDELASLVNARRGVVRVKEKGL
ncbi:hypothetical protein BDR22DRAFT_554041 [Usnea florida]